MARMAQIYDVMWKVWMECGEMWMDADSGSALKFRVNEKASCAGGL